MIGPGVCALCRRQVAELTTHHLIPRTRHRRRSTRKQYDLQELRSNTVELCRPCHANLHDRIDPAELERACATVSDLARHPHVASFTHWISQRPDGITIAFKAKKRR